MGPSSAQVSYANYRVEKKLELKKKGKPFDEQEYFYSEALVGTDGKGSKLKYINAAIKYGTDRHRKSVYGDIIFISILVFIALLHTLALLRFPVLPIFILTVNEALSIHGDLEK